MPRETGSVIIPPNPPESTMFTPAAKKAKIGSTMPDDAKESRSENR